MKRMICAYYNIAYEYIICNFYFSPDACARKKWSGLRDYFLKVHKQQTTTKSGSAGAGGNQRKWHLYSSMLFLLPYVTDQKASCNLSEESEHEMDGFSQMSTPGASNSSVATPDLMALTQNEDLDAHPSRPSSRNHGDGSAAHSSAEPNTTPVQSRKSKYKFPQERQPHSLDSDILRAIKTIRPEEKCEDEEELFLKSLAPKLRSLDPLLKLECQAEMQMLLLKYMRQQQATNSQNVIYEPRYVQPRHTTDNNMILMHQTGEASGRSYNNITTQGTSFCADDSNGNHYQSYQT